MSDKHLPDMSPAWIPTADLIENTNIFRFMSELNFTDVPTFHRWSVHQYENFWQAIIDRLPIIFQQKPSNLCDLSAGIESPSWLPGARLNIIDSCFTAAPTDIALIYEDDKHHLCTVTYKALNELSNRIANSLIAAGFHAGDPIAIAMPMNHFAVAIYLGIIKMGGVVVSIADSFASDEITARLNIANTKAVFTQDIILRGGKQYPLYKRICEANAPMTIVLPALQVVDQPLRHGDIDWQTFLVTEDQFNTIGCEPMSAANILFSSGTTAAPKAIVWNHTTPIKVASDAFFHQNIQAGDRLMWPTNLGWMMGPWVIFAALINRATLALYTDAPKDRAFGEFIQQAKVTMLGVVPTIVAGWRESHCMDGLDWSAIKVFSSTGECSNPDDMRYLMSLAGNKPVIEYCGGTEIGGAYVSSTVIQPNIPSQFSTPVMGIDFMMIDEHGKPADIGEVAIIPPSIGLATTLLNADQYKVYYTNMPKTPDGKILRRHGDQLMRLPNGYFTVLGRVDDTMNLGGIKVSAAEIERALAGITHITELAAIAVNPPQNGPSLLVIYAAAPPSLNKQKIHQEMQQLINQRINPLFRIHDVVIVKELPKTASNKIMRRLLRQEYTKHIETS